MDDRSGPASGIEAFWEIERFLEGAADARLDLCEVERESERRGRELMRLALQAHIDQRGDGDVGEAIAVQGPQGPVRLAYGSRGSGTAPPAIRRSTRSTQSSVCRAASTATSVSGG